MATTPQQIATSLTTGTTSLYTGFIAGGASRGMLVSLELTNTSTADITASIWQELSGGTIQAYLCKSMPVPAGGNASWRGMAVVNASGDKIRGLASTTGVDIVGAVVENG